MNRQEAEDIVETLCTYSAQTDYVLNSLEKYDYREEANDWHTPQDPKLLEPEHPTLRGLYYRLARFIGPIPGRNDNLCHEKLLNRENIQAFSNYLEVSRDIPLALTFNRIKIEPLREVAEKFDELNLKNEARRLLNIHNFAYGIRKWACESKNNSGAIIKIMFELNYDEATPEERDANAGYKTFSDLFRPDTNYSASQKRALYDSLKDLYSTSTLNVKDADRTVMAAILILRNKDIYKRCFDCHKFVECKKRAFSSFRRDCSVVKSYTDNSLESAPKIAKKHIIRAENIIIKAFSLTR